MTTNFTAYKMLALGLTLGASLVLSACSDSDNASRDNATNIEFEISVTNLSAAQPLSPAAILLHSNQWHSFSTGQPASLELEYLSEGGDNAQLLSTSLSDNLVYSAESGMGIIAPGESETFQVHTSENNLGTLSLSVLSMLVNSNDAIAALNNKALSSLELNESMSFELITYDTGTEANSESSDTIPGPAAEGGAREGFNAERDDLRDAVYVHPGVVTQNDGLSTSTLEEIHRWDNPAMKVQVQRIR